MKDADYQAWLESHPKCQRCNDPILKENYKGANYFARLFQEKTIVTSKFKFFMERIDITKNRRDEQTSWINTEFDLCNPCAGDVFDYAQGKEPQ